MITSYKLNRYRNNRSLIMIMALFLEACDSCGRIPLNDQYGSHTNDLTFSIEQSVVISDADLYDMMVDVPLLEATGELSSPKEQDYEFICNESCQVKF